MVLMCFVVTWAISTLLIAYIKPTGASATSLERTLNGISGAAALMGIVHEYIFKRCFIKDKGDLTCLGRYVLDKFQLDPDELADALSILPWKSLLLIGIILWVITLFLSL